MRILGSMAAMLMAGVLAAGCTTSQGGGTAGVTDALFAGSSGRQINEAERERANEALKVAMTTGQRTAWRGEGGTYGYMETSPSRAGLGSSCRDYVHTIYFDGRPQRGSGQACQQTDGSWKVVS